MTYNTCCDNCIYWKRILSDAGRLSIQHCGHPKHGDKLERREYNDGSYCKEFLSKREPQ